MKTQPSRRQNRIANIQPTLPTSAEAAENVGSTPKPRQPSPAARPSSADKVPTSADVTDALPTLPTLPTAAQVAKARRSRALPLEGIGRRALMDARRLYRNRHGTSYFRIRIGGRAYKRSLGTKNRDLATMRASRLNLELAMRKEQEPSIEEIVSNAAKAGRKFDVILPGGAVKGITVCSARLFGRRLQGSSQDTT